MSRPPPAPRISVLMPAYNAEAYVVQAVQAVLGQTCADFELIVVDDGSTDGTLALLQAIADPRLRVAPNPRNLGIVGTLNRARGLARGSLIARVDADDLCLPTRFARQVAFLDAHPEVVSVSTEQALLERGRVAFTRPQADRDPLVLRWTMLLGNPVGHASMTFRAAAADRLDAYLREDFAYAEDFDFSHRMLALGDIAVLPDHLVIYRQHGQSLTRTRRETMIARTAAVLARAHADLLDGPADADSRLVAAHLAAQVPPEPAELTRLGAFLERLLAAFIARHAPDAAQQRRMRAHLGRLWWGMIQASLREGRVLAPLRAAGAVSWAGETRPPLHRLARSLAGGLPLVRRMRRADPIAPAPQPAALPAGWAASAERADDPVRLFALADTAALAALPVFAEYGLRPVLPLGADDPAPPAGLAAVPALRLRRAAEAPAAAAAFCRRFGAEPMFAVLADGDAADAEAAAIAAHGIAVVLGVGPGRPARRLPAGPLCLPPTGLAELAAVRPGTTQRSFLLHLADLADGHAAIAACRHLFDRLGAMPGHPADLVAQDRRDRVVELGPGAPPRLTSPRTGRDHPPSSSGAPP